MRPAEPLDHLGNGAPLPPTPPSPITFRQRSFMTVAQLLDFPGSLDWKLFTPHPQPTSASRPDFHC